MNSKKRLFIDGTGGKNWIGGLYYKRNILYGLLSNTAIAGKTEITVITDKENMHFFEPFHGSVTIRTISYNTERERKLKLYLYTGLLHADYLYPVTGKFPAFLGVCGIGWIPDFQHNRLPKCFSDEERDKRTYGFQCIADKENPLVLSSFDSLNDFHTFYSSSKKNVYVVPFVSYIEPEICSLSEIAERKILEKFDMYGNKYVAVMNQFWQHKNHIIVIQAIQIYFAHNPDSEVSFAFTGNLTDYRNPEYVERIKQMLEISEIKKHIKMLGFIDRIEQLAIMKNAEFIIQPSLFEGWGTVVEDAKSLDKTIILSDIPIHQEQKNEKCVLFNPYDANELARIIDLEVQKDHADNMDAGLQDMHRRAKEYSKGFEQLFRDMEK